jgi:hypothetical protein
MPGVLKWGVVIALIVVVISVLGLLGSCGGSDLPTQPGEYSIQPKSLTYDGQEYSFYWVDKDKSVHHASVEHLKMVQDERTFLEVKGQGEEPVLHLTNQDPILVKGEDDRGRYESPWLPFAAGALIGHSLSSPYPGSPYYDDRTPVYRYPPTSSFGRDDTINGSITNNKASAPDYKSISSNPNAVSGASGGTGGGTAASGKSGGGAASGASGGTGTGSAATNKGGFAAGSSSFSSGSSSSSKVGGGSGKSSTSSSSGSRSSGSSSRGSSGGRSGGK